MTTRLLLVSNRPDANAAYLASVQADDVQMEVVSSFIELYQTLSHQEFNGVLIDLPTKIKTPQQEKELVNEVLDRFPVIQLNWDPGSQSIRSFFYGQSKGVGRIHDFIEHECRTFQASKARFEKRIPTHFNVELLALGEQRFDPFRRTVTLNISKGGCYLYLEDHWQAGDPVQLILREIDPPTPLTGVVKWGLHWGERMALPGIGIQFLDLSDELRTAILKRIFY